MEPSFLVGSYAERVADPLGFDPSLARRVRQEVVDHLCEASEAGGGDLAAQQRAIASFGDPTELARQFALVTLVRKGRRASWLVLLAIVLALFAMRARLAWYAAAHLQLPEQAVALAVWVGAADRWMFWLSVVLAVAAWADLRAAGYPLRADRPFRKRMARYRRMAAAATGALLACVCGDIALTALRFRDSQVSSQHAVPLLSLALEIACVAALVWRMRALSRHAGSKVLQGAACLDSTRRP
jgi:hypothetical protein